MMTAAAKVLAGIVGAFVLLVVFYIGALFLAHGCDPDFLKIDSCLDGGGRWDYERRLCESPH